MSSTLEKPNPAAVQLSPEDVRQFLHREARFLDDKEWESWLALYAPDVEFWMPAWDDDGQLVTDPQPLITRKKVILKNDCIHHVVDIYHI